MDKLNNNHKIRWSLLIMVSLIVTACFEPEEGCLDVEALNYQIDADQSCPNCCTYPSQILNVQHRFVVDDEVNRVFPHSSTFDPTTHLDDFGNPFQFKELRYFLSNIHLITANGAILEIQDTVSLTVVDGSATLTTPVENNFVLVESRSLADYTIGEIRGSGTFTELAFNLGLIEPVDNTLFSSVPEGNALDDETLYISDTEGFIFLDMELYTDTIANQLDSVRVLLDNTDLLPAISLPINFDLTPGFNPDIIIQADYGALLREVNVKTDDAATIRQKIVNNITNLFSVTEITATN